MTTRILYTYVGPINRHGGRRFHQILLSIKTPNRCQTNGYKTNEQGCTLVELSHDRSILRLFQFVYSAIFGDHHERKLESCCRGGVWK